MRSSRRRRRSLGNVRRLTPVAPHDGQMLEISASVGLPDRNPHTGHSQYIGACAAGLTGPEGTVPPCCGCTGGRLAMGWLLGGCLPMRRLYRADPSGASGVAVVVTGRVAMHVLVAQRPAQPGVLVDEVDGQQQVAVVEHLLDGPCLLYTSPS